mmetsp:Transcript_28487/g.59560  ORF Transcript_28487/g.59560 Transcript_28487/m.59560 type:complete len:89 (+) Transcript_28487:2022-2288(+)
MHMVADGLVENTDCHKLSEYYANIDRKRQIIARLSTCIKMWVKREPFDCRGGGKEREGQTGNDAESSAEKFKRPELGYWEAGRAERDV